MADRSPRSLSSKQLGAMAIRIVGAGLGFLATLYATQLLGAENAGVFFASLAWAGFLAIIVRWGLQDVMLLHLPALASRATEDQISARAASFFRVLSTRSVAALFLCIGAAFTTQIVGANNGLSIGTIAAMFAATAFLQLLSALAKARQRALLAFAGELALPPLLVIGLLFALSRAGGDLSIADVTSAYVLSGLAGISALVFVSRTVIRPGCGRSGMPGRLKRRANAFATTEMALFLTAFLVIMIMPFLAGTEETGLFNLALRIVAVATLVPASIAAVITPHLVQAHRANDGNVIRKTSRDAHWVMAASALVYGVGVATLGPMALHWAGSEFLQAKTPMLVMMVGFGAGLLLGPTGVMLAVTGRESINRKVAIWAAISTALALLAIVPRFGMQGAAVVVGGSFFLQRLALFVAERKARSSA